MMFFMGIANAQNNLIGFFDQAVDIGDPKLKGETRYNKGLNQFLLKGAGANMWFAKDEFHFANKKLSGDFILSADIQFIGRGNNPHRKIGWMVRQTLDSNAAYADAAIHGDGLTSLQYRKSKGADTEEVKADIQAPDKIQFERRGNLYIFSAAKNGEQLREVARVELDFGKEVYAGIFICSHDENTYEEAVFSNVKIAQTN
jgi:regulation of enolase protein 1 (concanavalin A-like superfamily)